MCYNIPMKIVHLISKKDAKTGQYINLVPQGNNIHLSGCWVFKLEKAETLEGGWLFLHETKAQRSFMGGLIKEVRPVDLENHLPGIELDRNNPRRVIFKFESRADCMGKKWRGQTHRNAWNGGIIDCE